MEILEAIETLDRRLLEWLRREGVGAEEREALVRARAALNEVESRLVIARIVDPKAYEDYRKRRLRNLSELA